MDVLNELKPGLDEKLYERPLVIELRKRGHDVEVQKRFPVSYCTERTGDLIPDVIVDETFIVDPKVVTAFNDAHVAQMVGYLAITDLELALLLNFKSARLEWKRVVRQKKLTQLSHLYAWPPQSDTSASSAVLTHGLH
jgi:GxxExxY protein